MTITLDGTNGVTTPDVATPTINSVAPRLKNDIINGQFRIAQIGTSFAGLGFGVVWTLDGWFARNGSSTAVLTSSQSAGRSTGKYALQTTVTTAQASVAAGDYAAQCTRIEGYDCVKYLTGASVLGVWIKAPVTGVHCVSIYNGTSSYVQECDVLVAGTPQFFALQFPVTPVIASAINSYGLEVRICNMAGATYQTAAGAWAAGDFYATANQVNDFATVSNVFALEDVTLNLGTVPTVDDATYGEDLRRCQRYFCKSFDVDVAPADGAAHALNTVACAYSTANCFLPSYKFPVSMRANPSLTFYGANGAVGNYDIYNGGWSASTTLLNVVSREHVNALIQSTGLTAFNSYLIAGNFTASARL